jgi:purine-nucleoside phosphorylase
LTNAAGGLNPEYAVGDFMVIADHLNLTGHNPLTGTRLAHRGEAFVNMIEAYSSRLREHALRAARGQSLRAHAGTYAGLTGPSFETPAETRMLRLLGADVVGMSTVVETIAARALGLDVLGISLVTNVLDGTAASVHADVLAVGHAYASRFANLIEGAIATFER